MLFNNQQYSADATESVLDLLLRQQQHISYSCKNGHCQTCLLKALNGNIDAAAQKGLKNTVIAQGYFLACQQKATSIESACYIDDKAIFSHAKLISKHFYNSDICRLRLETTTPLYYHAGQFVNLKNSKDSTRSYSLASLPSQDSFLEFHILKRDNGKMSRWIFEQFNVGDSIEYQGAIGDCFYTDINPQSTIILIGTSTGAAPLYGIARDAIHSGHKGNIHFYHGGLNKYSLYLHDELEALQKQVKHFYYIPSTTTKTVGGGIRLGRCNEIALSELAELSDKKNTIVYVCGNPEMVAATKKKAFLAGVSLNNIYSDPFEHQDLRQKPRELKPKAL